MNELPFFFPFSLFLFFPLTNKQRVRMHANRKKAANMTENGRTTTLYLPQSQSI